MPTPQQLQDIRDMATECDHILAEAQANGWSAPDMQSKLGSLRDYQRFIIAATQDAPVTPPTPPEPPPEPPPADRPPVPNGYQAFQRVQYGQGARRWGNLGFPTQGPGTGRVLLVQIHGGGWMQGDPNVAAPRAALIDFDTDTIHTARRAWLQAGFNFDGPAEEDAPLHVGLRQMTSMANGWGWVTWEPAYTYAPPLTNCLVDAKLAVQYAVDHLDAWGCDRLVLCGHSAGGHLALRMALDPSLPAPIAAIGLCAAGLSVHGLADLQGAPGGNGQGGTGWIFQTAWGSDTSQWPGYAPDTHLQDRAERFPILLVQGDLGGGQDGSILNRWGDTFATRARQAGWIVNQDTQSGRGHLDAANWSLNQRTAADVRAIVGT